jgi:hypothetical protein
MLDFSEPHSLFRPVLIPVTLIQVLEIAKNCRELAIYCKNNTMVKCNDSCFYNRFLLFNILITVVVFYIHSSILTQVERFVSYTAIYPYFMTLKWTVFERIQWKNSLVNGIVLLYLRLRVNTAHLRLVSNCNGHIR